MNVGLRLDGPRVVVELYSDEVRAAAALTPDGFEELLKGGATVLGRARALEQQLAKEAASSAPAAVARGAKRLSARRARGR